MRFTLIATPLLLAAASNAIPAGGSDLPPDLIPVKWAHLKADLGPKQTWFLECTHVKSDECDGKCEDYQCQKKCLDPRSVDFRPLSPSHAGVKCGNVTMTAFVIYKLGWTIDYQYQS